MYTAVVEPGKVAQVLSLRRKVTSVEQLEQQVVAGLPKSSLGAVALWRARCMAPRPTRRS